MRGGRNGGAPIAEGPARSVNDRIFPATVRGKTISAPSTGVKLKQCIAHISVDAQFLP